MSGQLVQCFIETIDILTINTFELGDMNIQTLHSMQNNETKQLSFPCFVHKVSRPPRETACILLKQAVEY